MSINRNRPAGTGRNQNVEGVVSTAHSTSDQGHAPTSRAALALFLAICPRCGLYRLSVCAVDDPTLLWVHECVTNFGSMQLEIRPTMIGAPR